jgi:hypothetical protein
MKVKDLALVELSTSDFRCHITLLDVPLIGIDEVDVLIIEVEVMTTWKLFSHRASSKTD